jgi:hypothetical protein
MRFPLFEGIATKIRQYAFRGNEIYGTTVCAESLMQPRLACQAETIGTTRGTWQAGKKASFSGSLSDLKSSAGLVS